MKNDILKELSGLWLSLVEDYPKVDYDDILHRIEKMQLMVFRWGGEIDGKEEKRQKRKTARHACANRARSPDSGSS